MAGKGADKTKPVVLLEFDAENGIADIATKDWSFDVEDINQALVSKYDFPDADRHGEFLQDAIAVMQGFSRIALRDNIVIVPSDLTEFKRAKAQFQKACTKLDELAELMFAIRADATADMLLNHFDVDNELDSFRKSLPTAMGVFAKIEALTGTAGNRPTGDWVYDFCVHCQRFWAEQKGGGTRLIYEQARRTHISYWAEDVFMALDRRIGRNTPPSKLKSVARDVPAYRPPNEPITGNTP